MHETTSHTQASSCPYCGGKQFFRSKRSGVKDWFRHFMMLQNPYRCAACDERFFRTSHGHQPKEELHHHV